MFVPQFIKDENDFESHSCIYLLFAFFCKQKGHQSTQCKTYQPIDNGNEWIVLRSIKGNLVNERVTKGEEGRYKSSKSESQVLKSIKALQEVTNKLIHQKTAKEEARDRAVKDLGRVYHFLHHLLQ